jgi:hypothetical protein
MNHQHDVDILRRAGYPESPICAATDGGHIPSEQERGGGGKTSAALCIFEALKGPAEDGTTWEECKPRLLLVRVKVLPERMGDAVTDNDTGELEALTLTMMALPMDAASFTVIDSTAARGKFLHLRDQTYGSPRHKTRRVIAGISKSITCQLDKEITKQMTRDEHNEASSTDTYHLECMMKDLKKRVSSDPMKPWRCTFWDMHRKCVLVKVDSHQMNNMFAKGERYDTITPNACAARMNQHADNAAALGTLTGYGTTQKAPFPTPHDHLHPLGLRFEAALGEATLYRDSASSTYAAVERELAYRLATKETQGASMRLRASCGQSLGLIPDYGVVRQVTQGKGHACTRSIYKNVSLRQRHAQWVRNPTITDLNSAKVAADDDILQCCFCLQAQREESEGGLEDSDVAIGRTEHLHLYCAQNKALRVVRNVSRFWGPQLIIAGNSLIEAGGLKEPQDSKQKKRKRSSGRRRTSNKTKRGRKAKSSKRNCNCGSTEQGENVHGSGEPVEANSSAWPKL